MSEEDLWEGIRKDTKHFVTTFCDFHKAFPDENQHIFDQIYEQIKKADKHNKEYIPSEKGHEVIWTFERNGTIVYKRVFHPGYGEKLSGVDFALYKAISSTTIGITAVQVKRNRGRDYFEFDQREITQRNRLERLWGSAYYLMVDETCLPPLYCFIRAIDLHNLMEEIGKIPPVRVPNIDIRRLCRGLDPFYDLFYGCRRGSKYAPKEYFARMMTFIRRSKRTIVEISRKTEMSKVTVNPFS